MPVLALFLALFLALGGAVAPSVSASSAPAPVPGPAPVPARLPAPPDPPSLRGGVLIRTSAAVPRPGGVRPGPQAEPFAWKAFRERPSRGWVRPVVGRARVSQSYGIKGKWAAGHHTGIDLAVPSGTPVRSVGAGRVVFAGWSGAYGKAVTVRMRDRKHTLFAHLSKIYVKKGKRVRAGTLLARSGSTGRSTGPHLHFEVRAKRRYGSDIDPVGYLASKGVQFF